MRPLLLMLVLSAPALLTGDSLAAEPAGKPTTYPFSRYAVLMERNMFARDRTSIRGRGGPQLPPPGPVFRAERNLVLAGISDVLSEEGESMRLVAFVEDTRSGRVTRLTVGSAVGQGKVTKITLDSLDYEMGGSVVQVAVGRNLEGAIPVTSGIGGMVTSGAGGTPTTGPSATSAPGGAGEGGDAASIEEMLKRRREQDLN